MQVFVNSCDVPYRVFHLSGFGGRSIFLILLSAGHSKKCDGRQFPLDVCTGGTLECVVVEFYLGDLSCICWVRSLKMVLRSHDSEVDSNQLKVPSFSKQKLSYSNAS
jgi:hypothetical protein